jgi:N-acetylmuramoyl-L-alanine amidase
MAVPGKASETNRVKSIETNLVTSTPPVNPAKPKPAPAPPAHRTHRTTATWVPWSEWAEQNGWGKPERVRNTPTWTYQIKGSHGVLEATAGSRTALWNGLNLELGFAPRRSNGDLLLHALDLEKTLDPLTAEPPLLRKPGRTILIDPGHGGFNYGAKSALGPRYEKEFALDWAFRLARLLENRGWTVHLTRTNDVELSLAERVAMGDRLRADLFVSLHFNSTDEPQARAEQGGIETYCLTPVGMPSSLTRHYEDGQKQAFPNNAFDGDNYHFAVRFHRALVNATDRKDRGVRRARFMGVLKGQARPAVLLEAGYLTSASEAQLISTPAYRQKLAEAAARALE